MRRGLVLALTCLCILSAASAAAAQERRPPTLAEVAYPQAIRVAIRESRPGGEPSPRGRIIWVKTTGFDEYQRNVLPNEWLPSWHPESLKAGAVAVKMFAWYHTLNPTVTDGFSYDVDNTTNFQAYREGRRTAPTDAAIAQTRRMAFVERTGEMAPTYYRAGYARQPNWQYRNRNKMAQWGSHYWAERGQNYVQILQWYYQGKVLTPIPGL